jgi:hypothetical protein
VLLKPGGQVGNCLEIQQGFAQHFQIGHGQGLDVGFLGWRQWAETAAQLPQ